MSGPTIESAESSANPRDHAALHRMMAESFSGVYLTMLSIIQGVALTDLTTVTFSDPKRSWVGRSSVRSRSRASACRRIRHSGSRASPSHSS
jgi:hypothetical protein